MEIADRQHIPTQMQVNKKSFTDKVQHNRQIRRSENRQWSGDVQTAYTGKLYTLQCVS